MSDQNVSSFDDEPISLDPEPDEEEPISLASEPARSDGDKPVSLVDGPQSEPAGRPAKAIKPVGAAGAASGASSKRSFGRGLAQVVGEVEFKRPMNLDGAGATRCRIFHSKVADAPLKVMETHINEWIDGDQIEVKHVGHVVGAMQGKSTEPNVIVIIWY